MPPGLDDMNEHPKFSSENSETSDDSVILPPDLDDMNENPKTSFENPETSANSVTSPLDLYVLHLRFAEFLSINTSLFN